MPGGPEAGGHKPMCAHAPPPTHACTRTCTSTDLKARRAGGGGVEWEPHKRSEGARWEVQRGRRRRACFLFYAGLQAVQASGALQPVSPGGDLSWSWDSPRAVGEGPACPLLEPRQGPPCRGKDHLVFRSQAVFLRFLEGSHGVERTRNCGQESRFQV